MGKLIVFEETPLILSITLQLISHGECLEIAYEK